MWDYYRIFFTDPIYCGLIIVSLIVIFVCYFYGKNILGYFGEHWTKQELNKLPKDKYKLLNNIFIKIGDKTYQIDHIVVSRFGIFVIETKQYNGYIIGDKYDKKWVRYAGQKRYYYTNPIRQNYGHVKAISELLEIDENKVYNIVCIPSNARLKISHDGELVRNTNIVSKILSYNNVVINNVDGIVNVINQNNIKDRNMRKEHIQNIRNNIIDDDTNKCPKCGGALVQRGGKYGKFIGCSNFPKCKYTKNIDKE